jgi:hypothetical protein
VQPCCPYTKYGCIIVTRCQDDKRRSAHIQNTAVLTHIPIDGENHVEIGLRRRGKSISLTIVAEDFPTVVLLCACIIASAKLRSVSEIDLPRLIDCELKPCHAHGISSSPRLRFSDCDHVLSFPFLLKNTSKTIYWPHYIYVPLQPQRGRATPRHPTRWPPTTPRAAAVAGPRSRAQSLATRTVMCALALSSPGSPCPSPTTIELLS